MATAHAATAPANDTAQSFSPSSYTELLNPVVDPVSQLKAHDALLRDQQARISSSAGAQGRDIRKVDEHHHHHHHHKDD